MSTGPRHCGWWVASSVVFWLTASSFAQLPAVPLLCADYTSAKGVAKFEEIERNGNISRIRVVQDTHSSVGSSLFVMFAFYEVARARHYEYFINLDERPDSEGGRVYIVGFTTDPETDVQAEFGSQYRPAQPFGQKKDYPSVSRFAPLFERMCMSANAAPAPYVSSDPKIAR